MRPFSCFGAILPVFLLAGCADPERNPFDVESTGTATDTSTGSGEGTAGTTDASGGSGPGTTAASTATATSGGSTGDGIKFDVPEDETAGKYCGDDLDIVFVMDVSTSMGNFFDKLESSIQEVDAAVSALDLPSPPRYGLVVFVDDFLAINAGAAYTDLPALSADFSQWNDFTSTNKQVSGTGLNGTMPENSLDAIAAAAEMFQWRPIDTTNRIIIHTTNHTFWDGPMVNPDGIMIQNSFTDTVDKLTSREIRVFSFAASEDCSHVVNGVCKQISEGLFTEYQGNPPIFEATDGAVWEIDEVLEGTLSLADVIPAAVEESYCEPYPPPG